MKCFSYFYSSFCGDNFLTQRWAPLPNLKYPKNTKLWFLPLIRSFFDIEIDASNCLSFLEVSLTLDLLFSLLVNFDLSPHILAL